ncbi:MAG: Gfo/Idh/MocA family oxidoreductase [Planctomycetaceae bacterium]|jgi:predicted dehydrogenase|nr:Gfo/Idh/MocA family oxidoreductase [Planctomycetaceae bacterium]
MAKKKQIGRRRFLGLSLSSTLAISPMFSVPHTVHAKNSWNKLRLCVIGIRGRGMGLATGFASRPNAVVTHVCDVSSNLFGDAIKKIKDVQQVEPMAVQDLRRVMDDKTIDAIVVATPDHWHALATIWGAQAGKHVYVEKPISQNVFEGWQEVQASRKYDRRVQVGTQCRSMPHYREAIEYIRAGKLGKVHVAKAWNSQLRRRVPAVADSSIPEGLDWDIWQGPAPEHPYNDNRYTYGWRWLWDYGTGDMGNDGVHDLDVARWGLDVDYPIEIQCTGGKYQFVDDIQQTPDTQYVTFKFAESKMLVYEQRLWSPYHQEGLENGVAFYGNSAYMLIGRSGWKVIERGNKEVLDRQADRSEIPHLDNFLSSIAEGTKLNCDIEEGHRSTVLAHLGNLAYRLSRPLKFDPIKQTLIDDPEAEKFLKRRGRKSFVIPESV